MRLARLSKLALATVSLSLGQSVFSADWPTFGGDLASTKYSKLDDINADNVRDLQLVWSWDSADNATVVANNAKAISAVPGAFRATPLVIGGVVYISTSLGKVAAIDAVTGLQKWVFDTNSWKSGRPLNLGYIHRGVAYWSNGSEERILMPTNDAYLWSIDAKTGKVDLAFGDNGKVDLTKGLRRGVKRSEYAVNSAPLVINDIVVVGSAQSDVSIRKEGPPGDVRGFDVHTGEQRWIFHTIPLPGEYGYETWGGGSSKYTGNTNVWSLMSADEELGFVYLPVGTPTNDFYGGHRPGSQPSAGTVALAAGTSGSLTTIKRWGATAGEQPARRPHRPLADRSTPDGYRASPAPCTACRARLRSRLRGHPPRLRRPVLLFRRSCRRYRAASPQPLEQCQ